MSTQFVKLVLVQLDSLMVCGCQPPLSHATYLSSSHFSSLHSKQNSCQEPTSAVMLFFSPEVITHQPAFHPELIGYIAYMANMNFWTGSCHKKSFVILFHCQFFFFQTGFMNFVCGLKGHIPLQHQKQIAHQTHSVLGWRNNAAE